jgi:glyoxylase-like metal-dependent hydrolase (beta-lactamase superfamily II)
MHQIALGDVTITSIIEREGPWRMPADMFPAWTAEAGARALEGVEPETWDAATGRLVNTYQTFVVRTPHHTILIDTCTGEDKGYPPPMDFPKQPWLDGFAALGLRFDDIDYVFCTHLHIDHCGWNTRLVNGRWVPTFPRAKYVFHKREYAATEQAAADRSNPRSDVFRMNCEPIVAAGQALLVDDDFALDDTVTLQPTPGHTACHCCVNIASRGLRASVAGDLMHHALQCREPDWQTVFDWDGAQAVASRRRYLAEVADTATLVLPIHFPTPTVGRVEADGDVFRWRYVRY